MTSIVLGGSGKIGRFIVAGLGAGKRERIVAVSRRRRRSTPSVEWVLGDLLEADRIRIPDAETLYCTPQIDLLASALPQLRLPSLRRVVAFSSSSVLTKVNSFDERERDLVARIRAAENQVTAYCETRGIAWTILRPTLVYLEGHDGNITRLARIIDRARIMPVVGRADGRRQPVHAEDLATAAIDAAASGQAKNQFYVLAGGDTISYREMIGRIFDGLGRRRMIVGLPPQMWKAAFSTARRLMPGFNAEMGTRMIKDMSFDDSAARADFGWHPRGFRPRFQQDRADPISAHGSAANQNE